MTPAPADGTDIPGIRLGIPNPFDLSGLPSPTDLIGKVFEFFFKTFFGIEAKVTQRTVEWLLAAPVYTDQAAYADLNELRANIEVAAWALFTLVFTVSAVRYYASGFTSAGSYEAVESLARGGVAAGALAFYPQVFGALTVATNYLTYGVIHDPTVGAGLTKLLAGATVSSFTPLGVGTIAAVVAVVIFLLLIVTKIVLATLLALLFVAAPLAIALWPLPETSWLARTVLQSLIGVLLWPVVWALCFALFAVIGASALTPGGSFGSAHRQAVGVGCGAVRGVQGAAAARAPGDARRADALARRSGRARPLLRPCGDARRRCAARGAEGVSGRVAGSAATGAAVVMRHPTYKHLEARLRLGAFSLGQWAQITAAAVAAAVFGGYVSPLADAGDDLRLDRRRRAAGRRLLRRDGARVLRRAVRPGRMALLAPAAPLPGRAGRADRRLRRPRRRPAPPQPRASGRATSEGALLWDV